MVELSKKEYWDNNYNQLTNNGVHSWSPDNYDSIILLKIFTRAFKNIHPKEILEIGCGNSKWLPFLGKRYNINVTGIDYSQIGCLRAQELLNSEGMNGSILCYNFLDVNPEKVGEFDLIYSLGFVEHFSDTYEVIDKKAQLLKPGGIILTVVPNLYKSIHGLFSWIYQPELYYMHYPLSKSELINAYTSSGLEVIDCDYAGLFSSTLIAWGKYVRYPKLSQALLPLILKMCYIIDYLLIKTNIFQGYRSLAPFLFIIGRKSD